jgi:hypothetical protein
VSDDDVRAALDLLARRADGRPAPDRVGAVRGRARRTAQVRTAVLATAAAVLVGVAGALVALPDSPFRRAEPAVTQTVPTPHLDVLVEQVTDPAILAAAGRGRLPDARQVVLRVRVTGLVPGGVFAVRVEQPGLGYSAESDPRCPAGGGLLPAGRDELHTLDYAPESGAQETVVVTATACAPADPVTQRVVVQVPPGGTGSGASSST